MGEHIGESRLRITPLNALEFAWHGSCASEDGKKEVRMPIQRSISRIVTPGPPASGCQKVGHSFIEVIQADDFINTDLLF